MANSSLANSAASQAGSLVQNNSAPSATWQGIYPSTVTSTPATYPYYTSPIPPEPPPRKQEFTILNEGTQDGVFLRSKDGKLHWLSVEKAAVALGLEW